jgi:asparagine synthase (glutamine-hydrolysing)
MGRADAEEGLARLDVLRRIESVLDPDPIHPFARVLALETCLFLRDQLLPDIDWASMAHSIEVRVPLLDPFLLRKIAPVLAGVTDNAKHLIANSPRRSLPDTLHARPKRGFGVPIRDWLKGEFPDEEPRSYGMRLWARRIHEWTSASA